MAIEQKIEKPTPAEHPKSDFGGERSVIRGYAGAKLCVEHVACIRALGFGAEQYFKCDRSRWTDGHGTMKSYPRRSEKEWPRRLRDTEELEGKVTQSRPSFFFVTLCLGGFLNTEMLAGRNARAIHEFAVGDAVAAFDLDVLHAQHCRATANYKQAILLRRQNDAGRAACRNRLERLPPNPGRRATGCRECGRPGLQTANPVIDFWRRQKPINSAIFLLQRRRVSGLRTVLRCGRNLASIE